MSMEKSLDDNYCWLSVQTKTKDDTGTNDTDTTPDSDNTLQLQEIVNRNLGQNVKQIDQTTNRQPSGAVSTEIEGGCYRLGKCG